MKKILSISLTAVICAFMAVSCDKTNKDLNPETPTDNPEAEAPAGKVLGLALGSPIFPSGCEGKLGVALESLQGRRDLT